MITGSQGRRLLQLFTGLALYGISMAFMVESGLGLTSWDVFHQGVSKVTGLTPRPDEVSPGSAAGAPSPQ